MIELTSRERLQPSLLDRLTDDAPEHSRETFEQQTLSFLQLRHAVLRDLAWLLNTTNLATTEDLTGLPRIAASTLNFGAPGFAGAIGTTKRLNAIEVGIGAAIRAFEPRIRPDTLKVRLRPSGETVATPTLAFEIEGELWSQPVPVPIFLETSIELESRHAVVVDARPRG